jgi:hypothetical protein
MHGPFHVGESLLQPERGKAGLARAPEGVLQRVDRKMGDPTPRMEERLLLE